MCKDGNRKDGGEAIFVFGTQGDVLMTFSTSSTLHFHNFCLYIRTSKGPKKVVCIPYQSKTLIKVQSSLTLSEWHPLRVVPCASFSGPSLSASSSSSHFCPSPLLSFHSFCSAQWSTVSSLYSHHCCQLQ